MEFSLAIIAIVLAITLISIPARADADTVWLSDLDISRMSQDYSSPHKDASIDDNPLSIAGRKFERGIGTHAESLMKIDLQGKAERLHAWVGIPDDTGKGGSVEFQVYNDDKLLWTSGVMRGGDVAKEVDIDIKGCADLLLAVTNGGDDISSDQAAWADAWITTTPGTASSVTTISAIAVSEPVILTPKPPKTPRINGAKVFGVRPGSPFLFTIPATGERPMTFFAEGLPTGLKLDGDTGRITGVLQERGKYTVVLRAKNALGEAKRDFRIVVGEKLALTPPMGWSSWNCWGLEVAPEHVRAAADALVKLDLINHGWTYVNIDDGWQATIEDGKAGRARKAPDYALQPDARFQDMKGLADYVHSRGLKIGLYSTPLQRSYGGRVGGSAMDATGRFDEEVEYGPYSFEKEDANSWAAWGYDYMKYDWHPLDIERTRRMSEALRASGRDIIYSISSSATYELADEYTKLVQLWRTTGDIHEFWSSVYGNGFSQDRWKQYAGPGHWNDPDILVIGRVGWGDPQPTKITPDEQYTHVSLWCLLAAPLLLGCDLSQIDEFTLGLITNDEVIEVDQDPLGKQAGRVMNEGGMQVWAKPMEDGSIAVGLFNLGLFEKKVTAKWSDLGIEGKQCVRDLWRQKDLGTFEGEFSASVARHGVALVRIRPAE